MSKIQNREATATNEVKLSANTWTVAPGVWRLKDIFVNIFIIQDNETQDWVLVDAGISGAVQKIKAFAAQVIGPRIRPVAIVLTHAHADHRAALQALADEWQAPVYAHHQEQPYLNGTAAYPPPDPGVGGGLMATLSFVFPKSPINIQEHLNELPADGSVPHLPGWRWLHTPGHTPGHISLWRESDGVLIAGDAFVTTRQESLLSVITQQKWISGPPKYFTPDWGTAARSVRMLAGLKPEVIGTGHGHTAYGAQARKALNKLSKEFWQRGMPATGRYVKEAAIFDVDGIPVFIPKKRGVMLKRLLGAAALLAVGYYIYKKRGPGWKGKVEQTLGKQLMAASLVTLGASAPASAAAPALPVVPAI